MKKILAVLLALVAIGGFVFAEDAAPAAAPTGPVVTYGLTGSFGFGALRADALVGLADGSAALELKNVPIIGFASKSGQTFKIEPWFQVGLGDFSFKAVYGYKSPYYDETGTLQDLATAAAEYDQLAKFVFGLTHDGLSFTSAFIYNHNNYSDSTSPYYTDVDAFYNETEIDVVKDNVEGGLLLSSDVSGIMSGFASNTFTFFYQTAAAATMRDWYLKVGGLFGIMDVSIGGTDTNWSYNFRPYGLFPSTSVINYQSTARTYTGFWLCGDNMTTVPVYTEYNLTKWVPITLKTGLIIPIASLANDETLMIDWLEGSNQWYAVAFDLKDLVNGEIGFIPNFGTDRKTVGTATTLGDQAVLASEYWYDAHQDLSNTIFGDVNLAMVPNLTARVAFDATFGKYVSAQANATTGTGTAADPYKATYVSTTLVNFGLEGNYDLKDVVSGLKAYYGVYGGFASGKTALTATGTAWANPAGYVAPNYTEATYYAKNLGAKPFMFALRGAYTFADKSSAYVQNLFTANTAAFADATVIGATAASGYYSTDAIQLNYAMPAGTGKLSLTGTYTMYLGLPTAADLGLTTADQGVTYAQFVNEKYNPWSFTVSYTASF